MGEKTEFKEPEAEEKIVNTDKIYELLSFYKIPLIFTLLAIFLLGGTLILWQSGSQSAKITFTQEESATSSAKIKVDIEGAVARPGVYELTSGSRIQDLLIAAGGLGAGADREWVAKNLNLAAKVVDGGKVYIPAKGEVGSITSSKSTTGITGLSTGGLVNINAASQTELEALPAVGPVTAQKIIDSRPYQTIEELVSRKIVGKSTFEKIKDKISTY